MGNIRNGSQKEGDFEAARRGRRSWAEGRRWVGRGSLGGEFGELI
jgi:hypothetical protein